MENAGTWPLSCQFPHHGLFCFRHRRGLTQGSQLAKTVGQSHWGLTDAESDRGQGSSWEDAPTRAPPLWLSAQEMCSTPASSGRLVTDRRGSPPQPRDKRYKVFFPEIQSGYKSLIEETEWRMSQPWGGLEYCSTLPCQVQCQKYPEMELQARWRTGTRGRAKKPAKTRE